MLVSVGAFVSFSVPRKMNSWRTSIPNFCCKKISKSSRMQAGTWNFVSGFEIVSIASLVSFCFTVKTLVLGSHMFVRYIFVINCGSINKFTMVGTKCHFTMFIFPPEKSKMVLAQAHTHIWKKQRNEGWFGKKTPLLINCETNLGRNCNCESLGRSIFDVSETCAFCVPDVTYPVREGWVLCFILVFVCYLRDMPHSSVVLLVHWEEIRRTCL